MAASAVAAAPHPGACCGPDRLGQDRHAHEPALEVLRQRKCATVAAMRLLLHALEADDFERARHQRIDERRGLGSFAPYEIEGLDQGGAGKRGPAREQGIKNRAQTVNVGRRRKSTSGLAGLFGRHVRRRSHQTSGLCQFTIGPDSLGQAEVGHMRLVVLVQEDVGRLQVAVQYPALMGVMERGGGDRDDPGRGAGVSGEFGEPLVEACTSDQLHAEIRQPLDLADLVDRDDLGMIQLRNRLRLVLEPQQLGFGGKSARLDDLERNFPVKRNLAGLVDNAHAAAAQFLENFIPGRAESLRLVEAEILRTSSIRASNDADRRVARRHGTRRLARRARDPTIQL